MSKPLILTVDDDEAVTSSLALLLKQAGYPTASAAGPEEALQVLAGQKAGLVLQGTWTKIVLGVWIIVGVYWLVTQVYWFPMILELESEKVLLALRNALGLVIISPVFSLTVAAILLLLTVLCISLTIPALAFMAVLLLLITNHATRNRLAYVQEKREKWEQEENEEE